MSFQSCVIYCILHFFPCNLAHVGIQFNAVYTAISRKVVAKTVRATIPKGNMGYDQYTSLFLTLQLSNLLLLLSFSTRKHMSVASRALVPLFEISLKTSDLKTTHNTFRDCRVHFFREPFSKQLYTGIEDLQIASIFRHKGSYLAWRKLLCHCSAYKSFYYFINYKNCIISRLNDSIIPYRQYRVNAEPLPNDLSLFRK